MAELLTMLKALEKHAIMGANIEGEVATLEAMISLLTFPDEAEEKEKYEKLIASALIRALSTASPNERVKQWGLAQSALASGLTWPELRERMRRELGEGDAAGKMTAVTNLSAMSRKEKEGVAAFILRFQAALQAVCPRPADPTKGGVDSAFHAVMRDMMVRALNHKSLQAHVRRSIMRGQAETWNDFIAMVRAEAAVLGINDISPVVSMEAHRPAAGRSGPASQAAAVGEARRPRRATAAVSDRDRRRRLGLCYRCGGKGHQEAECTAQGNGGEAGAAQ